MRAAGSAFVWLSLNQDSIIKLLDLNWCELSSPNLCCWGTDITRYLVTLAAMLLLIPSAWADDVESEIFFVALSGLPGTGDFVYADCTGPGSYGLSGVVAHF
jgi:hypothetical protein